SSAWFHDTQSGGIACKTLASLASESVAVFLCERLDDLLRIISVTDRASKDIHTLRFKATPKRAMHCKLGATICL
ncbi:MAG: hypothetical protein RSE99_13685, partial [Comamonas sp.]